MASFRIAHLSDPHLPPTAMRLRDIRLKRVLSSLAWRRKRHRHAAAVLEAMVADVAAAQPDHVIVTGDLTNFSTPGEHRAALDWLKTLGAPANVTVSPGNHDILVAGTGPALLEAWRPWLGDPGTAAFPFARRRGRVLVLNLCSATAMPVHLAQGELGDGQIARAAAVLREAGAAGLFRIVIQHHPVTDGIVPARKALRDRGALRDMLGAAGAELVLHGHAHRAVVDAIDGPAGRIPVLGVPSASTGAAHDDPAQWRLLEIAEDGEAFAIHVTVRGLAHDGAIAELGRYRLAR